jgi:hypothetical protein
LAISSVSTLSKEHRRKQWYCKETNKKPRNRDLKPINKECEQHDYVSRSKDNSEIENLILVFANVPYTDGLMYTLICVSLLYKLYLYGKY